MQTDDRSERAANVATVDQVTPLTTFSDTVNSQVTIEGNENINPVHYGADPYPDAGLQKVLSRMYPIKNFNWSYNQATGATLTQVSLPLDLFNLTTMARIDRYKYFRAGVEVSVRLNTTMFNSGMALISWVPHYRYSNVQYDKFSSIYAKSSNNCITISANTQDTVTFVIPYISPSSYLVVGESNDNTAIAFLDISVLVPLKSGTSASPVISGTVYARFLEAEVSGPLHTQSGKKKSNDQTSEQEAKNPAVTSEAEAKSSNNTAMKVLGKVGSLFYFASERVIGNVVDRFADYALGAKSAWKNDLNSVMNELDLPTTVKQIDRVAIVPGSNFSFIEGLDNSSMLALTPHNKVAKSYKMFSSKIDYDSFKNYKRLPTILTIISFDTTASTGQVIYKTLVTPLICHSNQVVTNVRDFHMTHLANLASMFQYWRGDIQFMIQFVCSKFVSSRVRIEWIPTPDYVSTTATNVMQGDNVSKVYDISGDTLVTFTIPYLRQRHWCEVGTLLSVQEENLNEDRYTNGQIRITIVNPVNTSNTIADSTISAVIWISGGESFQVAYPTALPLNYSVHAQSGENIQYLDPRRIMSQQSEGLIGCRLTEISGMEHGDGVESFSELARRYEQIFTIQFRAATPAHTIDTYSEALNITRFSRIHNTFHLSRGSSRYKLLFLNNVTSVSKNIMKITTVAGAAPTDLTGQAPLVVHQTDLNPVAEIQVPFYYNYPLYAHRLFNSETDQTPHLHIRSATTGDIDCEVYKAVGDDYKLGWPVAPPKLRYTTP